MSGRRPAPKKYVYSVPDMEAANRLGEIAQDALETARERAPDQGERASRLFREIYGPLEQRPCNAEADE